MKYRLILWVIIGLNGLRKELKTVLLKDIKLLVMNLIIPDDLKELEKEDIGVRW